MSYKYRYDHQARKHKKRHTFIVFGLSLFVVAIIVSAIVYLIGQTTKKIAVVNGPSVSVGVVAPNPVGTSATVREQYYTFNLPLGWKQVKVVSNKMENSITWESFVKNATNRYFSVYVDPTPTKYAVNRELPLEAHGSSISFGTLSDNCANFTGVGSTKPLVPVLAKWQEVNFYCNSPNFADNQIGTGTTGSINSVTLTGTNTGVHHFFFLYIDRNTSPDYTIFYSILNSFQAN